MEAILKFNLPEDNEDFKLATNAPNMYGVLWDMDQWLRTQTKYAADDVTDDTYKAFEECREQLRELMNNNNVNFDL